jgi:cold shock protein
MPRNLGPATQPAAPKRYRGFHLLASGSRDLVLKFRAGGPTTPTGTVKWYNDQKGYGFIQPDNGGKDVFVHATALERSGMRGLAEGQKVSYDVEADRRTGKESATNLQAT